MALTQTQVSQLYVSLFGRASEGEGNTFWQATADMTTAANNMLATTAAATYFGSSLDTHQAFVEYIYLNTLNKTVTDDAAGIAFWVDALAAGTSRGAVVASLINSAATIQTAIEAGSTAYDAATVAAAQQFENRVTVSDYTATTLTTAPADYATSLAFNSANQPLGELTVTDVASTVTAAEATIDAIVNPVMALTTATTDNIVGTAGADTISAVNSSLLSEGTLQATDKIDGAAGTDTANITMKQGFTGFTTGSMTNVETVKLTNASSAAVDFSAVGVTGATKYVLDATNASMTVSNLATLADVEVTGPQNTNNVTVTYGAASTVATGTQTDTQKLKLTDVGTKNTKTDGTTDAKVATVTIAKVEALNLETAGTANSMTLAGVSDARSITVSGAGQTEIQSVGANVTSFDASAATGNVIVNLSNAGTGALTSAKTGAGNDTMTVAIDDFTANATISGGAGTDTLNINAGGAKTIQATMTGVETVKVGAITGALTFSGANVSDLATITAEGISANATFANMKATPITVNAVGTIANAISADSAAAVTYNMSASAAQLAAGTAAAANSTTATFGGATAATINVNELVNSTGAITTSAGTVTLNVASKVVGGTELTKYGTGALTAAAATSLTVNATGQLDTAAITAGELLTANITAGSTAAHSLNLTAAKLTTLNVTSGNTFTLAGSTLTKVQNLTVDTQKAFTMGGVNLADAATVVIKGSATTSAATFGNLGTATTLTHNVNVTAEGQKAGLTIGTVDAGTASSTINVSAVTGTTTISNITANAGATLTATNIAGALTAGNITTTTGAVTVDVSNASAAATVGNIATNGTNGDITVSANNILGNLNVGTMAGNNVTFNAQNALGTVTMGAITAHTSANVTAANLVAANTIAITADATSTAFTSALNGGSGSETVTVAGGVKQTSITLTGNLGAGTNLVTTTLADSTATTGQSVNLSGLTSSATAGDATFETKTIMTSEADGALTFTGSVKDDEITMGASNSKVISISDATGTDSDSLVLGAAASTFTQMSISGIEKMTVATNAVSLNASAISGDTMTITNTTALTLTGSAAADVVDLSNVTTGATAANLLVSLGAGNDTIVLGSGAQQVVFAATAAANGSDTITGFTKTADTLNVSAFETAGAEVTIAAGARTTTAGTVYELGGLAAGSADSLAAAAAAITAGATWTAANATAWVILSDDNSTSIYEWADVAGSDGASAAELTLVGTISTAMSTAEIATATII